MKKKILSLILAIAAVLSVYSAWPEYDAARVHASANYGSTSLAIYARTVASEINRERAANGLAPLKFCDVLNEAAIVRAKECATLFDHIRPDGSSCFTVLDNANVPYYSAGENIAYGQKTPQAVMYSWMNSPDHKKNILSKDFEYVGVGVHYTGGTYYWTQLFTGGLPIDGEIVPYITSQPKNVRTAVGQSVKFEVKVQGSSLSYQWYYKKSGVSKWSLWNKHTDAVTYATPNNSWNGMQVQCRITDRAGMVLTSDAATVTIVQGPVITSQPKSVTVATGETARFEVKATGKNLKYQWYYKKSGASGWSKWNNHTGASTSGTANASWNGMQVYCRITDSTGVSVNSDSAVIKLAPVITKITVFHHPEDAYTQPGKSVSFSVAATGSNLKYQWYYKKSGDSNWTKWSTHTAPAVSAIVPNSWNGAKVQCKITDSNGQTIYTRSAKVKFEGSIQLISGPCDVIVKSGQKVSFSVSASGDGLSYQWYCKKAGDTGWKVWNGYTAASISATANANWNGMNVFCVMADQYGNTTSSGYATVYIVS